jgi:hypothetical protein
MCTILRINSHNFPTQYSPTDICNGEVFSFLCGRNWELAWHLWNEFLQGWPCPSDAYKFWTNYSYIHLTADFNYVMFLSWTDLFVPVIQHSGSPTQYNAFICSKSMLQSSLSTIDNPRTMRLRQSYLPIVLQYSVLQRAPVVTSVRIMSRRWKVFRKTVGHKDLFLF